MWRNHLTDILENKLVLKSSLADPDVWYKVATDETGFEYEIIDVVQERIQTMHNLYVDAQDYLPPNAPCPRGHPIQLNWFVDFDHAGGRKNCYS